MKVVVVAGGDEEARAAYGCELRVEHLRVVDRARGERERTHPARAAGLPHAQAEAAIGAAERRDNSDAVARSRNGRSSGVVRRPCWPAARTRRAGNLKAQSR